MPKKKAVDAIEHAHLSLQLTYSEIATAIAANESTLHRWRSGESTPTAVFRLRLAALSDLINMLERTYPDSGQVGEWLDRPLSCLLGRTPRSVLEEGRPDLLLGILLATESAARADLGAF